MKKKPKHPVYMFRRPEGRNNFPLVSYFYYTGETDNPWRCELHVTKAQQKRQLTSGRYEPNLPRPYCCRKCGMDWYR